MSEKVINFEFDFIRMGTSVKEMGNSFLVDNTDKRIVYSKPGSIFIDVGNALKPGIIDHHHFIKGLNINGTSYGCTAGLITLCKGFIDDSIDRESGSSIKLITHVNPDLDAFASAYLLMEYINKGSFPEHYEMLIKYVEAVDEGRMAINPDNIRTLFAACCFIDKVVEKQLEQDPEYNAIIEHSKRYKYRQVKILERGIKLVEYAMIRLSMLEDKVRTLDNPSLFWVDSPFNEEFELVRTDYDKYMEDKLNSSCIPGRMRLPLKNTKGEVLREADALFWKREPKCELHKYWARWDSEAPDKRGYEFTFIPVPVPGESEFTMPSGYRQKLYRAVISVNPNSDLCLYGLGALLEAAELEKESALFGEELFSKRKPGKRQGYENEPWVTNQDPWYDGKQKDYTIVDAPSSGSLLTIEEIEKVAVDYSKPKLKRAYSRYIYPFSYEQDIKNDIRDRFQEVSSFIGHESDDLFLPYIIEYLRDNRRVFRSQVLYNIDLPGGGYFKYYASIEVFNYGIGFLIIEPKNAAHEEVSLEDQLNLNRSICEIDDLGGKVFRSCISSEKVIPQQGLVFMAAELASSSFFKSEKKEILYKVCSQLRWNDPYCDCRYISNQMDQLYLDIGEHGVFGFGKNGGALLVGADKYDDVKVREMNEIVWEDFKQGYFEVFKLALHQRNSVMNFSYKLCQYWNRHDYKNISSLRQSLMDFTTKAWFSQISTKELAMQLYEHWHNVLQNKVVFDEVYEQLCAMDDYARANSTKLYERISVYLLPLAFAGTFMSLGIIKIKGFDLESQIFWIPFILMIIGLYKLINKVFSK